MKLVDYTGLEQARQFMAGEHAGQAAGVFANLPAYVSESQFGFLHLDIVVGRFGLYLSGPLGAREAIERLAQALIGTLQEVR